MGSYAERPVISAKEIGATGTNIWHGFVNEEFTSELSSTNGITVYNKMDKSDATVSAILTMIRLPILRANYYIEGEDERIKEYAERLMFKEHDQSFQSFLGNIIKYLKYGVMVFEKVYKKTDYYFIKSFAYRAPSSYYKWELDNGEEGLIQSLPVPLTNVSNPQIPQWKLLCFWNDKEGDDKWGRSVLRSAYKHWFFKDFAYRLDMMANEKWAMGIPVINLPKNYNDNDFTKAKEMAANIRSNEQAYLIFPEGWDAKILTGTKDSEGLYKTITHHDRQIAKNVLAQVIEMGQETGTQALGSTTMDFFMNGIEAYASYIVEQLNNVIKEMVIMNFGEQEEYPCLKFADLKQTDVNTYAQAVSSLGNAGFITQSEKTEEYIRQVLNLPELEELEEIEEEINPKIVPAKTDIEQEPEEEPEVEEMPEEKAQEIVKAAEDADKGINISPVLTPAQSVNYLNELKEESLKFKGSSPLTLTYEYQEEKLEPTDREKQFISDITDNEKILQDMWENDTEPLLRKYEQKIKDYLKKGYSYALTDKKGGVTVLKKEGNSALSKKMQSGVKMIVNKLANKLYSKSVARRKILAAGQRAKKAYKNLYKMEKFYEIEIPESQLAAFEAGYISNMKGNIEDGDGRRAVEVVIENFGGEAPLVEVLKGVDRFSFNDNNIKLSNLTHIRGAFKTTIQSNAMNEGFINYKLVLPSGIVETLAPEGETMKYLFLIGTISYWASRRDDTTANPMATSMHHNSQEYYYPIEEENIEYEQKLSKQQRKQLINK